MFTIYCMIYHILDLLYILLCDNSVVYNIFLNDEQKVAPPSS